MDQAKRVALDDHMRRFNISLSGLIRYMTWHNNVEPDTYRLRYMIDNYDIISYEQYRFIYYEILNYDLFKYDDNHILTRKEIMSKYYNSFHATCITESGKSFEKVAKKEKIYNFCKGRYYNALCKRQS